MSGLEKIASAITSLAVRGLASEVGRSRGPIVLDTEKAGSAEWELVEEQASVPGAPVGFNASIKFQLEEGPYTFLLGVPCEEQTSLCCCWQR